AYSGASQGEPMGEILHREPPPLAGRGIPAALENLVRRCLRKSPENRFAAGAALAEALAALADDRQAAPPSTAPQMPPGAQDTLAVLPFVNLGGDPDQEYFCNGLAEELIGALGGLPGLRVLARPPAGALLPGGDDLRALGREFGITKALEGSVRRSGGRLRISVQMIHVADGTHLWST